ncbi:MAG: hypothetical protein ACD_46C00113G0013 [uncultured bacterium]|nr:MAG: hypothetical protein ACD_46C00113G0013 [uncultured bacterium]
MKNDEQKARYEKWQAIIDEQEVSGLSQALFCKERNISSAQLAYYRGILKPKQVSSGTFTPVAIKQQIISKDIHLTLPNGFQCVFPSDLSASHIKELVRALLSC